MKILKVSALTASTAPAVIQQYDNNGKVFYATLQVDFERRYKINPQVHLLISCHIVSYHFEKCHITGML
jgi:hypothetical protein